MTLLDFIKNLSLSGWTSLLAVFCLLIEVTPLKINPIGWLGRHLNASMNERVDKIEKKLDNHITDGYRNYILSFQDKLIKDSTFTMEEWKKAIASCSDYEKYCEENGITNDVVSQAITFIRNEYQDALAHHNFLSLPTKKGAPC